MKKLIIASLMLAVPTVANAWPFNVHGDVVIHSDRDSRTDEGARRGDEGYRRYDKDNYRYTEGRWSVIADRYAATSPRQFIDMTQTGERFRRLRMDAVRGAPFIHKVVIEFRDGSTQVVQVERPLSRRANDSLTFALNGNGLLQRIIVYSEPTNFGTYSIFGEGRY